MEDGMKYNELRSWLSSAIRSEVLQKHLQLGEILF